LTYKQLDLIFCLDNNEENRMSKPIKKTVAEYFAGIGLVRMGLESQGWNIVFANDISEKKYQMYKDFFPKSSNHYLIGDIFKLNTQEVPSTILATCSFPCIDLSLAGNMTGMKGKHSSAFWGFINIIEAQKEKAPPFLMVENVPGWLSSNKGDDFRLTVQALNKLGYVCDVFILDALRFTPQSRLRVFLIGIKTNNNENGLSKLLKRSPALLSAKLKKSVLANLDLNWSFNDIPEPPPLFKKGLNNLIESVADKDPRWWSDIEIERHFNMMNKAHKKRVMELVRQTQIVFRTFYRRRRDGVQRVEVRDDDLSGCLRTAAGGSGKQFILKAGNGKLKMRAMTPREYARLQGVPDKYPINVNGVQPLTGFGDAVCVPAISWIAQNLLNLLRHPKINDR